MYNPHSLHQCEQEKRRNPRRIADTLMTGIGVVASASSVPQVIQIWQTGVVAGISLLTQVIALFAVTAWLIYGVYIRNKPLIITSSISFVVLSIVVAQVIMLAR